MFVWLRPPNKYEHCPLEVGLRHIRRRHAVRCVGHVDEVDALRRRWCGGGGSRQRRLCRRVGAGLGVVRPCLQRWSASHWFVPSTETVRWRDRRAPPQRRSPPTPLGGSTRRMIETAPGYGDQQARRRWCSDGTQYHATCANYAASIKQAIQTETLALRPGRTWPDKFAWSGGFYVTPNQTNAEAFGAAFLTRCLEHGGVVIMDLIRGCGYSDDYQRNLLGTTGNQAQKTLWIFEQSSAPPAGIDTKFGSHPTHPVGLAFFFAYGPQNFQQRSNTPSLMYGSIASSAPIDEGIVNDDNPTSETKGVALPNQEQIADIRKDASSSYSVRNDLWSFYDEFSKYDVVTGASLPVHLYFHSDITIALRELKFADQQPLNPALAKNQPALDQAREFERLFGDASTGRRREFKLTALL
ncbi:hypothetical protein FB451DRAFT_1167869 [Mycena latifolia]|nr:hypothetical protein FB451DRAFT_1167869 [Mycena latifolia]